MSFPQEDGHSPTRAFDLDSVQYSNFSNVAYFQQPLDSDDEAINENGKATQASHLPSLPPSPGLRCSWSSSTC